MKDSFKATVLAKKAEIYAELTKEEVPPMRTVDFKLSNAHDGWVEMTVLIDEKPAAEVRFSYCCGPDPIVCLLDWAEQIVSKVQVPQFMFYFGEGTDYQFYFENICYDVTGVVTGPSIEASVFSLEVLPGLEERKLICTLCDRETLVGNLYKAIQDFSERLQRGDENSVLWAWYFYGQHAKIVYPYLETVDNYTEDAEEIPDEAQKLVLEVACNNLESPIVEEYLQREEEEPEEDLLGDDGWD